MYCVEFSQKSGALILYEATSNLPNTISVPSSITQHGTSKSNNHDIIIIMEHDITLCQLQELYSTSTSSHQEYEHPAYHIQSWVSIIISTERLRLLSSTLITA